MKAAFGRIQILEEKGGSLVGGAIQLFQVSARVEPSGMACGAKMKQLGQQHGNAHVVWFIVDMYDQYCFGLHPTTSLSPPPPFTCRNARPTPHPLVTHVCRPSPRVRLWGPSARVSRCFQKPLQPSWAMQSSTWLLPMWSCVCTNECMQLGCIVHHPHVGSQRQKCMPKHQPLSNHHQPSGSAGNSSRCRKTQMVCMSCSTPPPRAPRPSRLAQLH